MSLASNIVKRPVLFLVIFVLIAIIAFSLVSGIPVEMFAEVDRPFLTVVTVYRGADPETVETSVTRILESQLANISGLQEISSTSSEGVSRIAMEFSFGMDIEAKKNDARDRIDRVRAMLPDGTDAPVIIQADPNAMPILLIAVQGDRQVNELKEIAENIILPLLEQVEGVAATGVIGGMPLQVRVGLSQNRLEAYGLTISGISGILAAQNIELGAGSIVDGSRNYSIRTAGQFSSIQDIAETVIAHRGGADIRLMDIGEVSLSYPQETSAAYINGENGVFVTVTRQSGTNSIDVADRVYKKLNEIRSLLPQGITLEIIQDSTTITRNMMDELVDAGLLGAVLAMLILFLFLRNIKSTIIIGISIPFSVLVTLLVMNFAGLTLNMLTMSGLILGIGMVVDCSIVILENIFKYRARGAKPDIAAILGSQEVMTSIIAATLTTLCVFIPIILFRNELGLLGNLIQHLIITVGISLASSLFIAIFLVPVLASKYLPLYTRTQKPLRNKFLFKIDGAIENSIRLLNKGYTSLLSKALKHRLVTTIIVVAAFLGSVFAIPRMQIIMMPPMIMDSFTLDVQLPQGTLYDDTSATLLQIQEIAINEINGIKNIVTEIEQAKGSLTVTLDLDMPGADSFFQARNRLRSHFHDFPNTEFSFRRGGPGFLGGDSDIDIALRYQDIRQGLETAMGIRDLIEARVPELVEISIDMTEGLPQVEVVIDRNRTFNLGLSVNAIAREIAAAMNGITATTFRYDGNEYAVVLELRDEDKERLSDLGRIFVASNTGNLIPLSNFASLERGMGPIDIRRQNQARVIRITGTLADSGMALEVEQRIQNIIETEYVLPDGIFLSYEGAAREIGETMQVFLIIFVLAILLVFGTMAGLYESFKAPFINMFTIPFILIGVVFIFIITGQPMSMFTMIGFVMLIGIVTNNGILLVDYTNLLVNRGAPVKQACLEAGKARMQPVLMTAFTTILGLSPLAFSPASSAGFVKPIGLTVIGGLLSSTFITLFFIPVIYSFVFEKRDKLKKKQKATQIQEVTQ